MRIVVVFCAVVGCAYQPGSFSSPLREFVGQRVTVGCLDLAVDRRADLSIGPVLAYAFANRCDHAAVVDLGAAAVIGRSAAGGELALRPYDPRGEVHAAEIDGRDVGGEALAYTAERTMVRLCVDAAGLAHAGAPHWLCVGDAPHLVAGSTP